MDKELVSIIVPVYNVRDYLEKCINSIINQIYKNLEIIIVDDGSTDGSSDICDRFLTVDKRILVIHKENGGVVSARQMGIERARGRYMIAIDSDDWIEPNMISELYALASENNADIVTSGCYRESGNTYGIITDGIKEGVYRNESKRLVYENLIFCDGTDTAGIQGWMVCKIMKTSLVKKIHSKISNKICYAEDLAVMYGCCVCAETIVITHNIYYHYVMRTGSAVFSIIPYYLSHINYVYLFLKSEFEKNKYRKILQKQLDLLMVKWVFLGINNYMGLDKEVTIPYYDFDRCIIKRGSKIVLYSAGKVGQSYYKQITLDKSYTIIEWVDKKFEYYQNQGLDVSDVKAMKDLNYDYILLAFKEKTLAESVKESLVTDYCVKREKILWIEPISLIDKYLSLKSQNYKQI